VADFPALHVPPVTLELLDANTMRRRIRHGHGRDLNSSTAVSAIVIDKFYQRIGADGYLPKKVIIFHQFREEITNIVAPTQSDIETVLQLGVVTKTVHQSVHILVENTVPVGMT
jgi:hypothetical protein